MIDNIRKLSLKSVKQMSASTKRSAIHKSLLRVGINQIDTKQTTSRLCPINRAPKGQTLYDTIAFLILYPKHRYTAVCYTYHLNRGIGVWLPFIYRSNKVNYSVAIEDGLCLILSDYDLKLYLKYKEELPFDTKIFTISEYFSPKKSQSFTRINCLAILHSERVGFQCCRKTSRIHWISVEEICERSLDQFWGSQIHLFCNHLKTNANYFLNTYELWHLPVLGFVQDYYQNHRIEYALEYVLNSLGITRKQIDLLFNDFFEHCFPSLTMTFDSFVDYLSKYGFRETISKMRRLFNAFRADKCFDNRFTLQYLYFDDLLIGLAYIDKDSPHHTNRRFFVFRFYDQNRDGFLSEEEFREMVTDIHKKEGQEEIDIIVAEGMTGNDSPNGMNISEFYNRIKTHEFGDPTHLGKSDSQLLSDIHKSVKSRTTRPMDTLIKLFSKWRN